MKIFGLVRKNSGPCFHRIMMPLLKMDGVDTYITNNIEESDFAERRPDAVYYSRTISDSVVNLREKYGFKLILDIDDYWHLDYHHIAYQDYMDTDFAAQQIKHIQGADLITTTHERLADEIAKYNKNVIIIPNAIPDHEYFNTKREQANLPRIFWQGSITHRLDMELLRNPMKRISPADCMVVIAGYNKHPAWDSMVSAFTNGLRIKGAVLPGTAPHEYYYNYSFADICVAPLIESRFNSFKSNLKILEAAAQGLPVIASHVHPYLDMPVLYVKKQSDWYKHIMALVRNPELREQYGNMARAFCAGAFNFDKINQVRYDHIKQTVA